MAGNKQNILEIFPRNSQKCELFRHFTSDNFKFWLFFAAYIAYKTRVVLFFLPWCTACSYVFCGYLSVTQHHTVNVAQDGGKFATIW